VLFPLIVLGCSYWSTRKRTVLYWLTVPLLVFTLFLRIYLVYKIIPVNTFNRVDYFHGRELWAQDISGVAHGNPVVFEGQLREAPLYSFYSGMQGIALYPGENKKSEYEIWGMEDSIQGRDVTIVKYCPSKHCTRMVTGMGKEINYLSMKRFASYLDIRINLKSMHKIPARNAAGVQLEIVNHRDTPLAFARDAYGEPVRLLCVLHREGGGSDSTVFLQEMSARDSISAHAKRTFEVVIPLDAPVGAPAGGQCTVSFSIDDGEFEQSVNSERYGVAAAARSPG
jgi:hypothetical protein